MANIRAAKEKKMANMSVPHAPHKTSLIVNIPIKILAELRRLAAFHCQAFVFLECEQNQPGGYVCIDGRAILW
jgi:hypothetical protein